MYRIKVFLWNWLSADFGKQLNQRLDGFFKEKASDFQMEMQAHFREFREVAKDEFRNNLRREETLKTHHIELIEAIRSLKR